MNRRKEIWFHKFIRQKTYSKNLDRSLLYFIQKVTLAILNILWRLFNNYLHYWQCQSLSKVTNTQNIAVNNLTPPGHQEHYEEDLQVAPRGGTSLRYDGSVLHLLGGECFSPGSSLKVLAGPQAIVRFLCAIISGEEAVVFPCLVL